MKNALTPKESFLHPPGAKAGMPTLAGWWADIAQSPNCREVMQVALCEMVMRQGVGGLQDAANNALKLEGAKDLIRLLLNLGEPDLSPGRPQERQLKPV